MEKVVLWGTGIISGFITRLINSGKISNVKIACYVESHPSRLEFEGLKVFPASALSRMEYSRVLVASTFVNEIRSFMLENGISESLACFVTEEKITIFQNDGWQMDFNHAAPPEKWISFMKNVLFTNSIEFVEAISETGRDFSKYWHVKDLYKAENISPDLKKNQEDMLESLFMPLLKPTDILCDMACAWGMYSERFAAHVKHVDGLDYSEFQIKAAIENARKHGMSNIAYYAADARKYSFDKKYDAFVMMGLLLCIQSDADAINILTNIYNSMRAGGYLFVKDSLTKMREKVYGFNLLNSYTGCYRNMDEYEKMYTDMGFEIVEKRVLAEDFYSGVVDKPSIGYLMKKTK